MTTTIGVARTAAPPISGTTARHVRRLSTDGGRPDPGQVAHAPRRARNAAVRRRHLVPADCDVAAGVPRSALPSQAAAGSCCSRPLGSCCGSPSSPSRGRSMVPSTAPPPTRWSAARWLSSSSRSSRGATRGTPSCKLLATGGAENGSRPTTDHSRAEAGAACSPVRHRTKWAGKRRGVAFARRAPDAMLWDKWPGLTSTRRSRSRIAASMTRRPVLPARREAADPTHHWSVHGIALRPRRRGR